MLDKGGFAKVYALDGGWNAWLDAELPIEAKAQ